MIRLWNPKYICSTYTHIPHKYFRQMIPWECSRYCIMRRAQQQTTQLNNSTSFRYIWHRRAHHHPYYSTPHFHSSREAAMSLLSHIATYMYEVHLYRYLSFGLWPGSLLVLHYKITILFSDFIVWHVKSTFNLYVQCTRMYTYRYTLHQYFTK